MANRGGVAEEYDPLGNASDNKVGVKAEQTEYGTEAMEQSRVAGSGEGGGYYAEEGDDDEEDDGFTVKLTTQALSSMPTASTMASNARGARTAPQAMKTFNASGPGGVSASSSTSGANPAMAAKTTASLAPLTTLGGSNRVSIPPNPAIGSLLTQSDSSRYYAHLEASAMENYPDKPWNREGADPSDYFNYGFNEASWTLYRERQLALRQENGSNERAPTATTHVKPTSSNQNRSARMDTSSPSHSSFTPPTDSRDSYRESRDDTRRSNRDDDRPRQSDRSGGSRGGADRSGDRSSSDRSYEDRRSGGRGGNRDERRGRDYDDSSTSSSSRKRTRSPDRDEENRKRPRR